MPLAIGNLEKVRALAVSGRTLAIGGVRADAASQITFYDHVGDKGERAVDLPSHVLAIAGDDAGFVVACADGMLRWLSPAGAIEREVKAHEGAATGVAIHADLLASSGTDGAVRLWSRKSGAKRKKLSELTLSSLPLRAVAIDPAGEAIAGAGDDGVVRVAWLADGRKREMPGHDGSVLTLVFTPADGRLASGGEDGTTRLWYLVGDVEADVRGRDDAGHAGGTTAICFLPSKKPDEVGERFFTAGVDGKVRLWRTSERRKPRTFDTRGSEPIHALVIDFRGTSGSSAGRAGTTGRIYAAGDARTVFGWSLDAEGQPEDKRSDHAHGFDALEADLAVPAKRDGAVKTLAAFSEPEALSLMLRALEKVGAGTHELRALAASELAAHGRTGARKALRESLNDEHAAVRSAAFDALCTLETNEPLLPFKAALTSKFADVRRDALLALSALFADSPLAQGLIAGHLADADASVRRVAVTTLMSLHPSDPATPLRVAFERGAPDVRAEVLVRGALGKLLHEAAFAPIVGVALEDDDADVRRIAFVVNVLSRPGLLAWLESKDEAFARSFTDFLRRAFELEGGKPAAPGADDVISVVQSITPMYAQFTHPKLGMVAIFKPNLHTPIAPGDKVRLVGVKTQDKRAADYIVGDAPLVKTDIAEARAKLVGKVPAASAAGLGDADREPLLAALACRAPDTALRGARGLALFGDMRALGALLMISRDPDAGLRREAAYALVALQDRRAQKRLAWMMSDGAAQVRDAALACYATLDTDPLSVAAVALESSHEDVRVRGLDLLVKQGKGQPRAEALLQSALDDEASVVRAEAFRTLWSWHTADPLSPLDRALVARFPDLRLRAVNELTAIAKHKEGGLEGAARERLLSAIGDRDLPTAKAAYDATLDLRGKADVETHLAGLASSLPALRATGAKDASKGTFDKLRSPLTKALEDTDAQVRIAAIESLDALVGDDLGPLYVGLQSSHLDLRVRAAELLAARRDEQIVSPMQALIADKELLARNPQLMVGLRRRAATALASLGSPKLLRWFATDLIKDEDGIVVEQAARGVSNASRRGEEGHLLDLLGHAEIAVRSWAGEGLARLGDARALPVLTGTLRHDHPPIRIGAIISFASLGPDGYGGMLQGLDDASREVQRIVLSVILARDLRAFRQGEAPDLLATALSSQRPEVRFAAARAIELRMVPEQYAAHLVEVLLPERPEKAEDMAKWPDEATRARLMIGLAEALAGDRPEQRYAAAQALRLRDRPEAYFREAGRAVRLRSSTSPWVPETTPNTPVVAEAPKKGPLGLLRRLFAAGPEAAENVEVAEPKVPADEQLRLRSLAFGAYVGLLRQATPDDEAHRVRRDAIERIGVLVESGAVSTESATPALARALDDPNHLVRRAALAALRGVYPRDPDAPLALALASSTSDVVRAALDELSARGPAGRARIVKALDSNVADARRHAFDLLEKSAPPGSLEPLLAALASAHADLRLGVLERLATSQDPRVVAALGQALASDHQDLRLRAAELLAGRRDERAVDVLGACLRADEEKVVARARDALARVGAPAAVAQLAGRAEEVTEPAQRVHLVQAIGKMRGPEALEALSARFADDDVSVRAAAIAGATAVIGPRSDVEPTRRGPKPAPPDQALALRFGETGARSRFADVRLAAAARLDDVTDGAADALLVGLFGDRSVDVRARAVASYALRVEKKGAKPGPLVDVIRAGTRETMLSAAIGLATRGAGTEEGAAAFRPLLLFVRAGEPGERERSLLGLGTLGDARALAELETIASGGTEEAPVDESMQAAALEALGRMFPRLADHEAKDRVRDRIEANVASKVFAMALASVKALRWVGDARSGARLAGVLASGSTSGERGAAAEALGELRDTAAEAALVKALDDADADVRHAARKALDLVLPGERTRVELSAVESRHADISEPAAAFLAGEGDAGELLGKLGKIENHALRARLRYGLMRRPRVPGAVLAPLLADEAVTTRSGAVWVAGVARDAVDEGDRAPLGKALVKAIGHAGDRRRDAARRGDLPVALTERVVEHEALWAARMYGAPGLEPLARKVLDERETYGDLRVQAARCLGADAIDALKNALSDPLQSVRLEAASSLGRANVAVASVRTAPFDAVVLQRISRAQGVQETSIESAELRRVVAPIALGQNTLGPLLALARKNKAAGRLDAIAALGLSPRPESIAALEALAAKDSGESVDVRKAAYRALRRAQRRLAKQVHP